MKNLFKWNSLLVVICFSTLALGCSGGMKNGSRDVAADAELKMQDGQLVFSSPQQAVGVLTEAAAAADRGALRKVFGPLSKDFLDSGDAVADRQALLAFAQNLQERVEFFPLQTSSKPDAEPKALMLVVGTEAWPFPIVLAKTQSGWRFDTAAGKDEIINRRIGENELRVLDFCKEFVLAQQEYAAGEGKGAFAQRFFSQPNKRDGLYWQLKEGEMLSPMGPLVAQAELEGYDVSGNSKKPQPYHGYYYRILTSQGKNARGGAKNYFAKGRMTEGFAMLAVPADWGNSGVMSFLVGPDGAIYEKSFGPQTQQAASAIKQFDPDFSWSLAD